MWYGSSGNNSHRDAKSKPTRLLRRFRRLFSERHAHLATASFSWIFASTSFRNKKQTSWTVEYRRLTVRALNERSRTRRSVHSVPVSLAINRPCNSPHYVDTLARIVVGSQPREDQHCTKRDSHLFQNRIVPAVNDGSRKKDP